MCSIVLLLLLLLIIIIILITQFVLWHISINNQARTLDAQALRYITTYVDCTDMAVFEVDVWTSLTAAECAEEIQRSVSNPRRKDDSGCRGASKM